jgi:FKBP-type peptidyl-prolyl cis-trans isomerase FklB
MTEGSKWEIYIPQELAYGERGSMPSIKPFSALVFEVELFNVVAPAAKK